MACVRSLIFASLWIGAAIPLTSAEIPKAPVPKSPYIAIVYRYADTMLKNGRDKNGLFWSALDRSTLAPLTNRPTPPQGVREQDRIGDKDGPLVGSNPYHDENLLRMLSMLTDLSARPHYRAAADSELKWFAENGGGGVEESSRPWMLWDRCFEIAPEASRRFALGLVQKESKSKPAELRRTDGFKFRALAAAYAHTKDEQFARAIADVIERPHEIAFDYTPSLAIDFEGAAGRLPEPLASRLRTLAANIDLLPSFSQPHDVKRTTGFLTSSPYSLKPPEPRHTLLWKASHDTHTTAQVGMMCVSRYDNSGDVRYRNLIFGAADAYLNSLPEDSEDVWPMTFGHAISLQLAAWRHSANWKYMEQARKFGDIAVEKFWGTDALPKASFKTDHYEAITGADTLALALVELHLNVLHITAVRCPPNTIDR